MQPRDRHGAPYAERDTDAQQAAGGYDGGYDDIHDAHDTPPFGVGGVAPAPAPTQQRVTASSPTPPRHHRAPPGTARFEIRDRLIELDDLRRRGILSEEEFAAKKSELLNRI